MSTATGLVGKASTTFETSTWHASPRWWQSWSYAAIGVAACLAALGVLGQHYSVDFDRILNDERTHDESDVRLLSEQSAQSIEQVSSRVSALHGLARVVALASLNAQHSGGVAEEEIRANISEIHSGVIQVALVSPDGIVAWSSFGPVASRVDLSDREHIKAIVERGSPYFVGQPVIGRVSSRRTVQFAKAIRDSGGALIAISVVSVEASELGSVATKERFSDRDRQVIMRRDGTVLATFPGTARERSIPPDWLSLAREGVTTTRQAHEPGASIVGLRAVSPYDIVSLIERDESIQSREAIAAFHNSWLTHVAAATIIVLLGSLWLGFTWYAARRQQAQVAQWIAETSQQRLAEVVDHLGLAVLVYEAGPGELPSCVYAGQSLKRILGPAAEQFAANPLSLPVHKSDQGAFFDGLKRLFGGQEFVSRAFRIETATEAQWVLISGRHLPRDMITPDLRRIILTVEDISARRAAEFQATWLRERMDKFLQSIPGGVIEAKLRTLPDGTMIVVAVEVSRQLAELAGRAPESIETEIMARVGNSGPFVQAARVGTATCAVPILHADGRVRHFRCALARGEWMDDAGEVIGLCLDVTGEHLAREQMEQAARLSILGEMAATIAHEVNQPIAAIAIAAEILKEYVRSSLPQGAALERVEARIEAICRLAERAGALVTNIRGFSGSSSGPAELFLAADVVEDALVLLEGRLRMADCRVDRQLPMEDITVHGHSSSLQQVLVNLVGNSLDAYEQNGVEAKARLIVVTVKRSSSREAFTEITVADRAGGIPTSVIGRIFEPFFTTKSAKKGTGLGLSISHRIITEMGGSLEVINSQGGAVFTILVPSVELSTDAPMLLDAV